MYTKYTNFYLKPNILKIFVIKSKNFKYNIFLYFIYITLYLIVVSLPYRVICFLKIPCPTVSCRVGHDSRVRVCAT